MRTGVILIGKVCDKIVRKIVMTNFLPAESIEATDEDVGKLKWGFSI